MSTEDKVNYGSLFDTWADFDIAEASAGAAKLVEEHGLGPADSVSFAAFCYGYEKALEKTREAL
jgi:hypothetical protein